MAGECAAEQLLGGRYALVDVLGRGASGVVWRARDQLLQRDVAVKEIRFPIGAGRRPPAELREAILREARAAARLNHPGAITVFDVVEDDGRPLIVMELVDAPTLAEMVAVEGPLPTRRVAAIGAELLDALRAGHAAGIVHRDVKPGNVMVGPAGRVRLADFGVASVLDEARTMSGNGAVGSPAYMAPEQVLGEAVGPPADLWALGATMYFAVEGQPPYGRGGAVPTMMAIVREPPRPVARAGALAPLLDALLVKDPAARPTAPFVHQWLTEIRDAPDSVRPGERDPTRPFPAAPSAVVVAPVGPVGPDDPVVIPRPAPPEGPAPEPEPEPEPEPDPDPDPQRVPSEPDPLRVPAAPVPPVPPDVPMARAGPPVAPAGTPRARRNPKNVWVSARSAPGAVAALVVVAAVVVVALLAGRGDDGGKAADGPSTPSTAATATEVPADWVVYADPATGFTIRHPPGWTVAVDGSLTDFRDPSTGAYLRVDHVSPPGPSPEGAWLAFEPRFAAENAGYRRIRIDPTTYAGFPAAEWEYVYGGAGERLRAVDLGFVTPRYGFALNFQSSEADWDRLQPVFEAFQAGFRAPA